MDGSGAVTCPPMEEAELVFAGGLDMLPLFDAAIRARMTLTIFMIPSIPSTSISASTVCERSSTSSIGGPYPAIFVQWKVSTCTPLPLRWVSSATQNSRLAAAAWARSTSTSRTG